MLAKAHIIALKRFKICDVQRLACCPSESAMFLRKALGIFNSMSIFTSKHIILIIKMNAQENTRNKHIAGYSFL